MALTAAFPYNYPAMSDARTDLIATLRSAGEAAAKLLSAIESTRRIIVELASIFQTTIDQLPQDAVAALGLRVRVVLRGTPFVENTLPNLVLEYLPAVDEADYDVRPGATALFLEALGDGRDRFYLEIRSNPGDVVQATSSTDSLKNALSAIRGIYHDATSGPRLVAKWLTHIDGVSEGRTEPGPDASQLFGLFLTHLQVELEHRARFNVQLPHPQR